MPQLATWWVVIDKDVFPHGLLTHPYQSQLTMWWVVVQSCAKIGVPSISRLICVFKTVLIGVWCDPLGIMIDIWQIFIGGGEDHWALLMRSFERIIHWNE